MPALQKAFSIVHAPNIVPQFSGVVGQIDMSSVNTLRTADGRFFSEGGALRVAAVYVATTILADEIASLTYRLIEKGDKMRTPLEPPELEPMWGDDPNAWSTRYSVDAEETMSLMLWGKQYTMLEWDRAGRLRSRVVQDPNISVLEIDGDNLRLKVQGKGELNNIAGQRPEFQYIPLYTLPGQLEPVSPVRMAAELCGLALSYQETAARLMGRGLQPSVVVTSDTAIDDPEAARISARLERLHGGSRRAGGVAVIGGKGMKLDKFGMSMVDAEFIAQNEFVFNTLLAIWRVPPTVAGMVNKPSTWGTGVAEFSLGLQRFTLRPIAQRRQAAMQKYITRPVNPNLTVRYIFDSMLGAAPKDKNEVQRQSLLAGFTSVERVLAQNDEPPFTEDETVFNQLSLGSEDSMAFRDQRARATAIGAEAQAVTALVAAGVPLEDAWRFVQPDAPFIGSLDPSQVAGPSSGPSSDFTPPPEQTPGVTN